MGKRPDVAPSVFQIQRLIFCVYVYDSESFLFWHWEYLYWEYPSGIFSFLERNIIETNHKFLNHKFLKTFQVSHVFFFFAPQSLKEWNFLQATLLTLNIII